jgi:hypothetical protein
MADAGKPRMTGTAAGNRGYFGHMLVLLAIISGCYSQNAKLLVVLLGLM